MKIGIISRVLLPSGNVRWAVGYAKGLSALGHEVELIFIQGVGNSSHLKLIEGSWKIGFATNQNKTLFSRSIGKLILRSKFFKGGFPDESSPDPILWIGAPVTMNWSKRFDVLLIHDQFAGIAGLISKFLYGLPYIVFSHEPPSDREPFILRCILGPWQKTVFKKAALRCSPSQSTASVCEQKFNLPFLTVTHGCSAAPSINTKKENYVLFDTRWSTSRNPFLIGEIAEKLKNVECVVAGSFSTKELQSAFRQDLERRGVASRVKFRLEMSEQNLRSLYANALAYIRWPAISADGYVELGPSFGVFQALEVGCPVIVTKNLWIAEMLKGRGCAQIVELTADHIASAVMSLVNGEPSASLMAESAWKLAKEWSWENRCRLLLSSIGRS